MFQFGLETVATAPHFRTQEVWKNQCCATKIHRYNLLFFTGVVAKLSNAPRQPRTDRSIWVTHLRAHLNLYF